MKRTDLVAIIFSFFIFLGCQTATKKDSTPDSSNITVENVDFIKQFAKDVGITHIQNEGDIYDLDGKLIKSANCFYCIFKPNGHAVMFNDNKLFELDEKSNILWKNEPILIAHTLLQSSLTGEYMTLVNDYDNDFRYGLSRYDKLLVLNSLGKETKSFSFLDYFKKHPELRPIPQRNFWTDDGRQEISMEFTHGNSFSEIISTKTGRPELKGYVYYCNNEKVIYLFDRDLKHITGKIVAHQRMHDVHQYDENNLIAYHNAGFGDLGAIVRINMETKFISPIYEFTDKRQRADGCSSVQAFAENKLFIVHSECGNNDMPVKGLYFEFADLNAGKNAFIHIKYTKYYQEGRLQDLNSYFKHVMD